MYSLRNLSKCVRQTNIITSRFYFLSILYWLCYYRCPIFFSPLFPSALHPTSHQHSPNPLSSCLWVIHISSLASPFAILFLTSPCLFCSYHLCLLFPVPFPHPLPSPALLITLQVISISDSVPILVVCLVCFCFCFLGSVVDSCKFAVILLFVFFIFSLDKSL